MDYNIHKVCRVCLEEGAITSIYSTEFAMMPSTMMMLCAKIRVYKTDGLPAAICNNCIYRLGVAYHFKQECENSDLRLRQYLGILDRGYGFSDAETMTDMAPAKEVQKVLIDIDKDDNDEDDEEEKDDLKLKKSTSKRKSRYRRKAPDELKKRGPKPIAKVPQTCYECNKTFKCPAQLQMHIRTHTGERPYVCSYCPRRFTQKYNLQIHVRTHTGERPFQCEICSKQFSALGNFQAHQKIHTGVRDQICPVCNKAFFSSGDLSKHMITHTGIRNHHCDTCGKSFSRNRDMVAHKKKIHLNQRDTENYKCPECHKVFATATSLSAHFRTHNNGLLLPIAPNHSHHQHLLLPPPPISVLSSPQVSAPTPIAPTAIGGSLAPPTIGTMGMTLPPPPVSLSMLSHGQSSLSIMHTPRIPY